MVNHLAICSWSLQAADTGGLLQSLDLLGLTRIQVALDAYARDGDEHAALTRAIEDEKVSLVSGMMTTIGEDYSTLDSIKVTGGLRSDTHWEANLAHAKRCAVCAKQLGVNLVTLHAGFIPEGDPRLHDVMVERLSRVAEVFNEQDVVLGLETGQERAETLLQLLGTLRDRVRVGVNFDPANMILYGMGDPIQSMHDLREHIVQVHMKDALATQTPGTWGQEVPASEGQVDWDAFFAIVQQSPRPLNVVIEREAGDQRIKDIRTAIDLAKRHMGRVQA